MNTKETTTRTDELKIGPEDEWELLTEIDVYQLGPNEEEIDIYTLENPNSFRDEREKNNQETRMASTQFNAPLDTNRIKSRASHLIEEDIVEPAQQYLKKARDFSANAIDRGSELVKENPGYTIMGAAAVGFLVGAYVARRR